SLSPCLPVSLSPCLPVSLSPCLPVSLSPCLLVSLSVRPDQYKRSPILRVGPAGLLADLPLGSLQRGGMSGRPIAGISVSKLDREFADQLGTGLIVDEPVAGDDATGAGDQKPARKCPDAFAVMVWPRVGLTGTENR